MKRSLSTLAVAAAFVVSLIPAAKADTTLNGAGATFPYPIYSKWFDEYHKMHPNVAINYQSIGSGGGIRQVTAKTVDFGASDGPMSDEQLSKVDGKLLHIPTVLGAVVIIYNAPGVAELKLDGPTIAGIFQGKIAKWNDPAIAALNPGVALPDSQITVVHRADGSGTSYCFTDYLTKVSEDWSKSIGKGTSVNWPVGLGGKGNEGVASLVKQTPGSIGYTELIYALQNNISFASVKNAAGKLVTASLDSVSAAAAAAAKNMPADYRVSITNAAGENAYPISTFTWLLVYQNNPGSNGKILQDFLKWMVEKGETMAPSLNYAPLPKNVQSMVRKTIQTIK